MHPGWIALIGSGETSATGGQVFEVLAKNQPTPLKVALLETPAGFELNSSQVTMRVGEYLNRRLQNNQPQVVSVPARRREAPFSTQDAGLLQPATAANMLFMGPGSPTYAVRQLRDTLAWDIFQAAHRQGAAIALASAAAISFGRLAIPVYEIFKVGDDPHWKPGLDFFGPYGLDLVIIPHWNNNQGGIELDTSRCFIGRERFDLLLAELDVHTCVLGIEEHTSALLDLHEATCRVIGHGSLHLLRAGEESVFAQGAAFPLSRLGPFHPLTDPTAGISSRAWDLVAAAHRVDLAREEDIPLEILALAEQRQAARESRDWSAADALRCQMAALGWRVIDTPSGQHLEPG
jgi:hypothetical protein